MEVVWVPARLAGVPPTVKVEAEAELIPSSTVAAIAMTTPVSRAFMVNSFLGGQLSAMGRNARPILMPVENKQGSLSRQVSIFAINGRQLALGSRFS
jgi:hypothetical protein